MSNCTAVIAIDGPSGSGKSTSARDLSQALGALYLNTGAMYRAMGLFYLERHGSFEGLTDYNFSQNIELSFDKKQKIFLNGQDYSKYIKKHEASYAASQVSAITSVRKFLVEQQRKIALHCKLSVVEGRDIASVVFPQAFCKFFFQAQVDIRAQRRQKELHLRGEEIALATLIEDIKKRDHADSTRQDSPLIQVPEAIVVDTTKQNREEVLNFLMVNVKECAAKHGLSIGS